MNKRFLLISSFVLLISSFALISSTQDDQEKLLRFNGMYIGKTMEIDLGTSKIETYNYIRFYEDGQVICQSVAGYEPAKVQEWFNIEDDGKFERRGSYKVEGKKITFTVNNFGTEDQELEGDKTDSYEGEIIGPDQLALKLTYNSGEVVETTYKFAAFTTAE